jgi:outer membrane immunogenic protein
VQDKLGDVMKIKRLIGVAALASAIGTPAMAADMLVKAAPYSWSGIYFGGDIGWQGSRIDLSSSVPGETLTYAPTHSSLAGGGFIGVQKQLGQFVVGVEGGYLAATGNASLGATSDISIFGPGGTGTGQAKLRDIWSVGGRFGFAMGRWMPYVAGGYANGAFEFDAQNVPPSVASTETAQSSGGGGYVGVGIDWALTNNWILGADYRHYSFKTQVATGVITGGVGGTELVNIAPSTDTVTARMSYKFDWGLH